MIKVTNASFLGAKARNSIFKRLYFIQPLFMMLMFLPFQLSLFLVVPSGFGYIFLASLIFLTFCYLFLTFFAQKSPFYYLMSFLFTATVATLSPITAAMTMWYFSLSHLGAALTCGLGILIYLFCYMRFYRLIDYHKSKKLTLATKVLDTQNGYYNLERAEGSINIIYRSPAQYTNSKFWIKLRNKLIDPLAVIIVFLVSGGWGLLLGLTRMFSSKLQTVIDGFVIYMLGLVMIYLVQGAYLGLKILCECEKQAGKKITFI